MIKTNASLVIVPHWVLQTIRVAHRPLSTILDVVALSRLLSNKDMQQYYMATLALWNAIPAGLRDTFQCGDIAEPSNRWIQTDSDGTQPSPATVEATKLALRKGTGDRLAVAGTTNAIDLVSVLPHLQAHDSDTESLTLEYVFDVFYLTENVYGVSFSRRETTSSYSSQLLESYDNLLALLNANHKFEVVANTPAFQAYTVLARNVI